MNKRKRKKHHKGEFAEFCQQLVIIRKTKEGSDEFSDAFIVQAIEANGCYCGGCATKDWSSYMVFLGRPSDNHVARMAKITEWLDARPDVLKWKTGELHDFLNEDYIDIRKEMGLDFRN